MFDGSIGAGSVFMPYGGKYQLTETQAMVAKVPVHERKNRYCYHDELRL
jgi:phosphoribosylformylglycinamidine synthase